MAFLGEGLHQVFAEHAHEHLAPRLTVPVLAGERTTVGNHEVRCPLQEAAERRDAGAALEPERNPNVHASVAEVPVQGGAFVAELGEQREQLTQVVTQPVGVHGGVLPPSQLSGMSGGLEHVLLPPGVVGDRDVVVGGGLAQRGQQAAHLLVGGLDGVTTELDEQPTRTAREQIDRIQEEPSSRMKCTSSPPTASSCSGSQCASSVGTA